jgi:DNA-binding MurR/RpiR family transcriptional regulator
MSRGMTEIDAKLRQLMPRVRGPIAEAIHFVLANKDEIPVRSMRELAKRANVAPVTLVRLAQRLGFDGFDDFRKVYVEAFINRQGRNLGQAAQLVSLAKAEGALGFAAKFAERELEVQRRTVAALKEKDLHGAVQALIDAERIFVIGRRPYFAAAYGFAYSLRKAKTGIYLLDTGGGLSLELDGLSSKDVFLGFTSYPYSRITLSLAQKARSQGATVVAVTDSENAPIAHLADFVFLTLAQGYAFPNSISGAQLIANILVALTVSKFGPEALDRIRRNELEIKETGEYVVEQRARKQAPPAKRLAAAKPRKRGRAARLV